MTTIALRPRQGNVAYLTFISIVSALGGLLFGFDTVVISGTLAPLKVQFAMSATMEGWLVSSALLGSALGAAASGTLSDRFGRKPVLLLSGVLLVVCSVGCAFAWNLNVLVLARWIGGLGVGLTSLASPLYISEISTASLRGRMVTLFQFAITLGICMALFSNAWLERLSAASTEASGHGVYRWMVVDEVWRGMFGMEFFPAAIFLALCFVIPEAPRWLVKAGRIPEAMSVLERVGGPTTAKLEMQEIQSVVSAETGSLAQLFQPGLRKALFVALFLAISSELSGITVVFYYGPTILEQAGFSLGSALGGFVSIGLLNMLFTVVAIWLMDIAGRRVLLFTGSAGACLALTTIGEFFRTGHVQGTALVGMMCLFVACFAFSMGPIKWVVMSEIFPTKIRGRAMAIATVAVWVTDGIYNLLFPVLRDSSGVASTFFIFALVLIPQFFFIWKVMPETKGQTLEAIERSWSREVSLKR
jgi:sugar porter (SP) family MFS transporter